jgi:hypothetical protein
LESDHNDDADHRKKGGDSSTRSSSTDNHTKRKRTTKVTVNTRTSNDSIEVSRTDNCLKIADIRVHNRTENDLRESLTRINMNNDLRELDLRENDRRENGNIRTDNDLRETDLRDSDRTDNNSTDNNHTDNSRTGINRTDSDLRETDLRDTNRPDNNRTNNTGNCDSLQNNLKRKQDFLNGRNPQHPANDGKKSQSFGLKAASKGKSPGCSTKPSSKDPRWNSDGRNSDKIPKRPRASESRESVGVMSTGGY